MIPRVLKDRFDIESSLGAGGMGEVFLAHDRKLNRPVAIKRLLPKKGQRRRRAARFKQEGRLASQLEHPAIVRVYDTFHDHDTDYIVMEYVAGTSLEQRIKAGPPLSLAQVLWLGRRIADGMVDVHARGIIHRDLKSANILINSRGEPKISDFGIAKVTGTPALTEDGSVIGTYRAMSPEQALGKELDARTDLFSFGILLYEALTRTLPFTGANSAEIVDSILQRAPPDIIPRRPDAPLALVNLLNQLLQKDRDVRPNSFEDVVSDLNEIARAYLDSTHEVPEPLITMPSLGGETLSIDDDTEPPEPPTTPPAILDESAALAEGSDDDAISSTPRRMRLRIGILITGLVFIAGTLFTIFAARGLLFGHTVESQSRDSVWFAGLYAMLAPYKTQTNDAERIATLKADYWREPPESLESLEPLHRELRAIRQRSPGLIEAHRFAAEVWHHGYARSNRDEDYQMTRQILDEGRRIHPASASLAAGIVALELDRGDLEEAQAVLGGMQANAPDHHLTFYMRAMLENAQGNINDAHDLLEQALTRQESWRTLYHITKIDIHRDKLDEARQHLARLRELAPNHHSVDALRQTLEFFAGPDNQCESKIDRDTEVSIIVNCAVTLMNRQESATAIELLRAVQKRRPSVPEIEFNLGESCLLSQKLRCATESLDKVINLIDAQDSDIRKLSMRVQAHAHLGDHKDARMLIERILANSPKDHRVYYALAVTYSVLKDRENAVYWIQKTPPRTYSPAWFIHPWFDIIRDDERVRGRVLQTTPK